VNEASIAVSDEATLLLVFGATVDDGDDLSGLEIEIAVGLRGVMFERSLQRRPIRLWSFR
jgi:hypothetical protein